jgi:hypothetical protein
VGLVALVFAFTAGIFGLLFVAVWPLLAWGAFLAVHVSARWMLSRLSRS